MLTPDRLFLTWLRANGGLPVRPGYGAQPHGSEAKRRAGYPHGQAKQSDTCHAPTTTGRLPTSAAASRAGTPCAKDATSRPEKPAVQSLPHSPFLP